MNEAVSAAARTERASIHVSQLAGMPATSAMLIDVATLVAAYYDNVPDPSVPEQRVSFGTSGHRRLALERSFNESHVLAISQAICLYRKQHRIDGPLFLGIDTHPLSVPAFESALEVLAANGVDVLIAQSGEYTPTPAVSHAILVYNRGRNSGPADGIVITPSHNPPDSDGFKYNPLNGGPAGAHVVAANISARIPISWPVFQALQCSIRQTNTGNSINHHRNAERNCSPVLQLGQRGYVSDSG